MCCLSFDLQILITPLVSSNSSNNSEIYFTELDCLNTGLAHETGVKKITLHRSINLDESVYSKLPYMFTIYILCIFM